MQMDNLRKTHPMVLIAAVAITVFSLLGSAVITGLIPNAHSEKQGAAIEQSMEQSTINNDAATATDQTAPNTRSDSGSSYITDYKSKVQPHRAMPNSSSIKRAACDGCGKLVSVSATKQKGNGFMSKIRMVSDSYRTITQYNKPHYRVGPRG